MRFAASYEHIVDLERRQAPPKGSLPMKIDSVGLYPLVQRQEDPTWSFALATYPVIEGWVVEIRSEGKSGQGYAQAVPHIGFSFQNIKAALDIFRPRLIGRNPFEIESVLQDLDAILAGNAPAKAGIDGALHDLCAKLLDAPLHWLFGGAVRKKIPQLRIVQIKQPGEMAKLAKGLVEKGYDYLKIKLKGDVDLDVDRVAAIRDAIGPGPRLTLDPNQSYSPKAAIQALTRMEPHCIDLVEQPVPAGDLAGLELVTRNVAVTVEADEAATSVESIFSLVSNRVVDAISLKTAKLGGLRNVMLAARICYAGHVRCRFGATFGPRLYAAQALHAAAAFPQLDYACELAEFDHLLDDPYEGLEVDNGSLTTPDSSGTGVSIRSDYSFVETETGGLHLPSHI